jgi:hypothetical protein
MAAEHPCETKSAGGFPLIINWSPNFTRCPARQNSCRVIAAGQKLPAPLKFEESLFQFLVSLSACFLRATFRVPAALPSFLVQILRHPRSFCLQAGAQLVSQPPAPGGRAAAGDGMYIGSLTGEVQCQKTYRGEQVTTDQTMNVKRTVSSH